MVTESTLARVAYALVAPGVGLRQRFELEKFVQGNRLSSSSVARRVHLARSLKTQQSTD
jgi:hypothetical protein